MWKWTMRIHEASNYDNLFIKKAIKSESQNISRPGASCYSSTKQPRPNHSNYSQEHTIFWPCRRSAWGTSHLLSAGTSGSMSRWGWSICGCSQELEKLCSQIASAWLRTWKPWGFPASCCALETARSVWWGPSFEFAGNYNQHLQLNTNSVLFGAANKSALIEFASMKRSKVRK